MPSMAHQCTGLRSSPLFSISSPQSKSFGRRHLQIKARSFPVVAALISGPIPTPHTRDRFKLKETFEDAADRCLHVPMEGVSFTLQDFLAALEKYDFDSQLGSKVFFFFFFRFLFTCDFFGFRFLVDSTGIDVLIFSWFVSLVFDC